MTDCVDIKQTTPLFVKPEESRQLTDQFFIILLPLSFLMWLGIIIDEIIKDYSLHSDIWQIIFKWLCPEYSVYALLAVLVLMMFLKLLSLMEENWLVFIVTFSIIVVILTLIGCVLWKLFFVTSTDLYLSCMFYVTLALLLIYDVSIFICTREIGVESLGPMIQQPIRAIMHCFTGGSLFIFVIILLMTFISVVTVTLTVYFAFQIKPSNNFLELNGSDIRMRTFAFFLSGLYLFNFIWNVGFMVMADYFANYYIDEDTRRAIFVFRSFGRVSRYSLGTIAFLSTPILPSICASIMSFKKYEHPGKQSENKLINFISKLNLVANITEYASIQTCIYGSKCLKSIRQMIDLHHSNPLLFLTLDALPLEIMNISIIVTMFLGWFTAGFVGLFTPHFPEYIYHGRYDPILVWMIFTFCYATYLVYSTSKLLLRPATCTFSVNKTTGEQREIETSTDHELQFEPTKL